MYTTPRMTSYTIHCENLDSSLQQCRQRQSVRELFYAEPQLGPVLPLPPLHWQTWLTSQRGELLPGTMYSLRFTAYIVPCTVNSVQYTVYSARFLSLFCLYQLVPLLHVGLSSPGSLPVVSSCWGRTHYTLRGRGKELQMARQKEKKCISFPHHFNKVIGEGNDRLNSNDIEKANYFKSDIISRKIY